MIKKNRWVIVKTIILISILIPISILVYEMIFLQKDSVVFLENYPDNVGVIIITYYLLLLMLGLIWVIAQLKSIWSLKNEKTKNELLHLQSQVSPHFFFNMLNNLYGMIDQDAEKSKTLVLKLSDLMRYSIYEGEKEFVFIQEEIAFLKNYIELHQMRYHKTIDVQFNVIVAERVKIMPLLLIILLENAFKHGIEGLRENAYVYMDLKATETQIEFKIRNNFDPDDSKSDSGIGLKNLKRRLDLVYPKKHELTISTSHDEYTSKLQLKP